LERLTQDMCTRILWMMNLTLSIDDELVARARELAQRRGTTLNQLVRDHLEELVGSGARLKALQHLEELWRAGPAGASGGKQIRREDAYEERLR
jgi:hypothetical protein